MNRPVVVGLLLLSLSSLCLGQQDLDSLWTVWSDTSRPDSDRVDALCEFAKEYNNTNPDSALYYANTAYDFATTNSLPTYRSEAKTIIGQAYNRKGAFQKSENAYWESVQIGRENGDSSIVAIGLYSIGVIYSARGDYDAALDYYNQGLARMEETEEMMLDMANVVNNIAIIHIRKRNYEQATKDLERSIELYLQSEKPSERTGPMTNLAILKTRQGDYASAIDLYIKSLVINEEAGDEYSLGYTYLNIANLYYRQGDIEKFFENAYKSLKIRERLGDKSGTVRCLSNIASAYYDNSEYERALEVLNRSLALAEELDQKSSIGFAVSIIAAIQVDQGNYDLAFNNINRAIEIFTDIGDQVELARCYKVRGYYFKESGDNAKAIRDFKRGLDLAENYDIDLIKDISELLYQVYSSQGRSELALASYERYIAARDSAYNDEQKREILRREYQYEYDKRTLADSISFANQREIQEARLEQTASQRLALLIGLVVVFGFSVLLYSRNRLINKQKHTIEEQNHDLSDLNNSLEQKVEERTQEIVKINNRRNQEILEAVLKTEDTERSRISKDIHDGLQQTLTTSLINFQNLKKDLEGLSPKAMEKFEIGRRYLKNSLTESRSIAHALMPKTVLDYGVLTAFENTINDIDKSQEETKFHFSHNLDEGRLSNQQIEITLFRIFQEALNNVIKYAKATNVHIQLKEYNDIFLLTIEDDGQGFDLQEVRKKGKGIGFKSMQNRLDAVSGFLEVNSVVGRGTEIIVEINKSMD